MKSIIEIKNLVKYYGDTKAVDDISFVTKENQTFAFLGSNGAGKSTTINIICGILKSDSGEVIINGNDINKSEANAKKDIGIVFQSSVLDKMLSVKDNLRTRAYLYGMTKQEFENRFAYLAKELKFEDFVNKPIDKLSGGQARRVDIARALIHRPKILILDEPTTGLDPQTRQNVWKFLNNLKKENGLTIFLTTHYMEEANEADYVVIINKGKIVAEDTPVNLKNKYTHDFVNIYSKQNQKQIAIENQKFFTELGFKVENKKEFVTIEIENTAKVKELILKYQEKFEDFEVIKGKMDDVFLTVTGGKIEGGNINE